MEVRPKWNRQRSRYAFRLGAEELPPEQTSGLTAGLDELPPEHNSARYCLVRTWISGLGSRAETSTVDGASVDKKFSGAKREGGKKISNHWYSINRLIAQAEMF